MPTSLANAQEPFSGLPSLPLERLGLPSTVDLPLPSGDQAAAVGSENAAVTATEQKARELAPDAFGGIVHDGPSISIGFARDVTENVAALREALPDVSITGFQTRFTQTELDTIVSQITDAMEAMPTVVSVESDEVQSVVNVGVADVTSADATALTRRYGDAVHVFVDEPVVPFVAAGRDKYRDPILAGVHMKGPRTGDDCTTGFNFLGRPGSPEAGVITAGHCFKGQVPLTEWKQGGRTLGSFTRTRDVRRTTADAGTLTTAFGGGNFRSVTPGVFVVPGAAVGVVASTKPLNAGRRGDFLCVSAAYSGYQCGSLLTGGNGGSYTEPGQLITGVYKAQLSRGTVGPGDSGSPVFMFDNRGAVIATGILFAGKANRGDTFFFSQISNVARELNVRVYTSGLK